MTITLLLFFGLALLYIGADLLVRGSVSVALRFGITRLVIGLTIVAFGTSSPELLVSLNAAIKGNSAISLGNVIGSNICNIALILGLSALIKPLKVTIDVVRIQIPIMIAASVALIVMLLDSRLGRLEGLILFLGIILYCVYNIVVSVKNGKGDTLDEAMDIPGKIPRSLGLEIIFLIIGFACLIGGADLLVHGAISFAKALGVSEAVIGLTIVALGTSLPELATSVVASIKGESDISIGNVVGSNIFNILAIIGISTLVYPMVLGEIRFLDLLIMLFVAVLVLPLSKSGFIINRIEGAILILVYFGYIFFLIR